MNPKYHQARQIFKNHRKRLRKEVQHCHGIGVRLVDGNPVIDIKVFKKTTAHKTLEKTTIDGLPIQITEETELPIPFLKRTEKWRPAWGGVSIGHYLITAGTLGSCVFKNGVKYILSNNHILANKNDAEIGDDIYQPGVYDGGGAIDKIGELSEFIPIDFYEGWDEPEPTPNYVDCAIAQPTNPDDVALAIIELDYPSFIREPELGEEIIKSGRTTGITEGTIDGIGDVWIGYAFEKYAWFEDQIITSNNFAAGGDSGSLVISKVDGKAIGLLFAGHRELYYAILNKMTVVASELGINLRKEIEASAKAGLILSPSSVLAYTGEMITAAAEAGIAFNSACEATAIEPVVTTLQADIKLLPSNQGNTVKPTLVICETGMNFSPFNTNKGLRLLGPNKAEGLYRIADEQLERYELYRGENAKPDLNGEPYETFTELPHITDGGVSMVLYLVLRRRNKFDLDSRNIKSWKIKLDADGKIVLPNPEAPRNISIVPAASAKGYVEAEYLYDDDDENAATHWAIYFTDNGIDPDPEIDEPTVIAMYKANGMALLRWTSPAADNNNILKVLVKTRLVSGGNNYDSENTDIYSCTASDEGPEMPVGRAFLGHAAEVM